MMNTKDITLKPLGGMRGKKHDTLKGCTVEAIVDLHDGWANEFHHPTITLRKVRTYDDGERSEYELVSLRYQRHDIRRDGWNRSPMRGFMSGSKRNWSHSYGAEVRGSLDNIGYLQTGLTLIERAREAVRKDDKRYLKLTRTDDDMLMLIVGLRLIGVTVILRDAKRHVRPEYTLAAA